MWFGKGKNMLKKNRVLCDEHTMYVYNEITNHYKVRSMLYISNVHYYWLKICRDGKLILYVTFITLIYLKDQLKESS